MLYICDPVFVCAWLGVFLEGGFVDFLLLGTVNTWAMDRGRVVHECVHVNTHAHICVFAFAFSRGPACSSARCILTQCCADKTISCEKFSYAVFVLRS